MRQLDAVFVWLGVLGFAAVGLIVSFYVASIILPIILVILVFSALVSLGRAFYARHMMRSRVEIDRETGRSGSHSRIIDAEYEILDDDVKK